MRFRKPPATQSAQLEAVRRRMEHWRMTRKRRSPIPEVLWEAAVTVVRECGVNRTARRLRLNYGALKKRLEAASRHGPGGQEVQPRFVELIPPVPPSIPECLVELEDPGGAKMRIHLKGAGAPGLVSLTRAFWSAER